jgi:hypothetical protein
MVQVAKRYVGSKMLRVVGNDLSQAHNSLCQQLYVMLALCTLAYRVPVRFEYIRRYVQDPLYNESTPK